MTALLILSALNLLALLALAGVLVYVRRRDDRGADALLVAVERLTDRVGGLAKERTPGPSLVGRTLVINTRKPDDQTIRGVVHGQYPDRWTLRDATLVTPLGEQPVPGGVYHVPLEKISGAQQIDS